MKKGEYKEETGVKLMWWCILVGILLCVSLFHEEGFIMGLWGGIIVFFSLDMFLKNFLCNQDDEIKYYLKVWIITFITSSIFYYFQYYNPTTFDLESLFKTTTLILTLCLFSSYIIGSLLYTIFHKDDELTPHK